MVPTWKKLDQNFSERPPPRYGTCAPGSRDGLCATSLIILEQSHKKLWLRSAAILQLLADSATITRISQTSRISQAAIEQFESNKWGHIHVPGCNSNKKMAPTEAPAIRHGNPLHHSNQFKYQATNNRHGQLLHQSHVHIKWPSSMKHFNTTPAL